jgi:hypothetical protein
MMWLKLIAVACILFATGITAEDLKYGVLSSDLVLARLKNAPLKNSDRVLVLEQMFRDAGCQPTEETVKHLHEPNVLCILPGKTNSTIIIGGHLDHVEKGTGIVDDWSGASMLPSLYQSIAHEPRTHTFVFIGFAGEEEGMVGSEFYAKQLTPDERKQIVAMVNLECLGIGKTEVWTSHSDPELIHMLMAVAQSLKLPLGGVNVERVGTTDSESFAHYGISRMTITAITQSTWALLHSNDDNIKAIQPELYYDSYRLIVPYLALLDQQLPSGRSQLDVHK